MSKDKGSKNTKKDKAVKKVKVVSDYKSEGKKKEPALDAFGPKKEGKAAVGGKKKP